MLILKSHIPVPTVTTILYKLRDYTEIQYRHNYPQQLVPCVRCPFQRTHPFPKTQLTKSTFREVRSSTLPNSDPSSDTVTDLFPTDEGFVVKCWCLRHPLGYTFFEGSRFPTVNWCERHLNQTKTSSIQIWRQNDFANSKYHKFNPYKKQHDERYGSETSAAERLDTVNNATTRTGH